jgi:hypothetical protein
MVGCQNHWWQNDWTGGQNTSVEKSMRIFKRHSKTENFSHRFTQIFSSQDKSQVIIHDFTNYHPTSSERSQFGMLPLSIPSAESFRQYKQVRTCCRVMRFLRTDSFFRTIFGSDILGQFVGRICSKNWKWSALDNDENYEDPKEGVMYSKKELWSKLVDHGNWSHNLHTSRPVVQRPNQKSCREHEIVSFLNESCY